MTKTILAALIGGVLATGAAAQGAYEFAQER